MPFDSLMPLEREKDLYLEGIRLFNSQLFFEAHEKWEDLWHHATGIKRVFYQGLIQAAVALEHYARSNPRGVRGLYHTYSMKLRQVPPRFMGIDVAAFLHQMEAVLRPVATADPPLERGQITLNPAVIPQITLQYDPFDTGEATNRAFS